MADDAPVATRRRRSLVIAAIAVAAILVVGAVVFILVGGNNGTSASGSPSAGPGETPAFSFKIVKTTAIATVPKQSGKLAAAAHQAGRQTAAALDTLFSEAFLDPANWTKGTYASAFALFDKAAAEKAPSDVAALTAGADAGSTYEGITPNRGSLTIEVLMDAQDQPFSTVAKVTFTATGANKNGTTTEFVSQGHFFLQKVNGTWKVVAYNVKRADQVTSPSTSPTASGAPTGSPS